MNKYTLIIPTMWKSHRTKGMIEKLIQEESVNEIILIDNTDNSKPSLQPHPKLNYILETRNTYVNPSWNKGVSISKNELICLVSDDITFNPAIFQVIDEDLLETYGFVGQATTNFNQEQFGNPILESAGGPNDNGGWGCLIFFRKKDWIPIPSELLVWYGDNWMRDINPKYTSVLSNFRVDTEMSTTVDLPEFDNIKKQDTTHWISNFSKWKEEISYDRQNKH